MGELKLCHGLERAEHKSFRQFWLGQYLFVRSDGICVALLQVIRISLKVINLGSLIIAQLAFFACDSAYIIDQALCVCIVLGLDQFLDFYQFFIHLLTHSNRLLGFPLLILGQGLAGYAYQTEAQEARNNQIHFKFVHAD